MLAPIVLFVFNRKDHTQLAVEALKSCPEAGQSKLIIFSDGARDESDLPGINQVRDYIRSIDGFYGLEIIEREQNFGLAKNIILGVSHVIDKYKKVIVLEDDLICSPAFLSYMNQALDFYQHYENIFSISAYSPGLSIPDDYNYSTYFNFRNSSWGWGTWHDRWAKVDWEVKDIQKFARSRKDQRLFNRGGNDLSGMLIKQQKGKIDSWSIRFSYTHYRENAYSVCPVRSLIRNAGFDGSGTNCQNSPTRANDHSTLKLQEESHFNFADKVYINDHIMASFRSYYDLKLMTRIKLRLKEFLNY